MKAKLGAWILIVKHGVVVRIPSPIVRLKSANLYVGLMSPAQNVFQLRRIKMSEEKTINVDNFMVDGFGRFVPKENVLEIDKLRDELVMKIAGEAEAIQEMMVKFKQKVYSQIAAFVDLSASEYGKKPGGKKGNVKLHSYDHSRMIQVQISEDLSFDERLDLAKELIDKCLDRWTVEGKKEIRTIVNEDFAVNQKGKFNVGRILSLRRHRFDDPDWKLAMEMISDSLQVSGSKSYIRTYKRTGEENRQECITLDFSKL